MYIDALVVAYLILLHHLESLSFAIPDPLFPLLNSSVFNPFASHPFVSGQS